MKRKCKNKSSQAVLEVKCLKPVFIQYIWYLLNYKLPCYTCFVVTDGQIPSIVECRTSVIVVYRCVCVSPPLSPACVFSGLSVSSRWIELVGLVLLRSSCWWSAELRPFSYSWLSPCRRCQVRPNRWTATHTHTEKTHTHNHSQREKKSR